MDKEVDLTIGKESQEEISWEQVEDDLATQKEIAQGDNKKEVKEPAFNNFKNGVKTRAAHNLDFILDIPLQISVELGRAKLLVNDLLQLGQGSVIELTKLVGEPLDILVNGKEVARGEVVVVNEKFGVRLTDIIDPLERIKQLR
jgi:flagellar motor switch protein FliN/FliY